MPGVPLTSNLFDSQVNSGYAIHNVSFDLYQYHFWFNVCTWKKTIDFGIVDQDALPHLTAIQKLLEDLLSLNGMNINARGFVL